MEASHPLIGSPLGLPPLFWALLDYVSRAQEIEIRPSSVVHPPSTFRPSSLRLWHRLSLKLLHGFVSVVASPGPYAQTFLALLDIAHEIAICPSSVVRPSIRRPSIRPCRNYLWIQWTDFFQILPLVFYLWLFTLRCVQPEVIIYWIRTLFLVPSVHSRFSGTVKQMNVKSCREVPIHRISTRFFFFSKCWNVEFSGIFFFFINTGPYGSKNLKTLLFLQLWPFFSQTFSGGFLWPSPQNLLGFLEFQM